MNHYYINLAWRNLNAHRSRFILSVIAVAFGIGATIASDIITQSMRAALLKNEDMVTVMEGMLEQTNNMSLFVGGVIMFAGGFLIFNAFAMSVSQRRQQIGSLRALGMTRAQILRMMLTESLLIALLGLGLGLMIGPLFGSAAISFLREFSRDLLAFEETSPTPSILLAACILGVGVTLISMLGPAQRASRATPLDVLRNPIVSASGQMIIWKPVLGALIIILLFAYLLLAPPGKWAVYPIDTQLATLLSLLWFIALLLLLPAFIHFIGRLGAGPWHNVTARLIGDNLERARGRVTITVLTMAFGLTVITGLSGFFEFSLNKLIITSMKNAVERDLLFVSRLDILSGWGNMTQNFGRGILLSDTEQAVIRQTVGDRADIIDTYYVIVPELSLIGDSFFSYLMTDAEALLRYGTASFSFTEGNWDSARPLLVGKECGVLIAPLIANRNSVSLGDSFTVKAANGPVTCVVAGIGSGFSGASTVVTTDKSRFGATNPLMTQILPRHASDTPSIIRDLEAQETHYPFYVTTVRQMVDLQSNSIDVILMMFNILLILAVAAAALGIVNTTVMSVLERQSEILLLRSLGTTRGQVQAIIMGEAALMGFIGGAFGLLAGTGFVLVFATTYGGRSLGVELDLWPAALDSALFALRAGLAGFVAAPLIAALAAWWPARGVLKRSLVS